VIPWTSMPWLEDLKFPRGYQMGTHIKILSMNGLKRILVLNVYCRMVVLCVF
jgi:hypothetical protein